VLFLCLFTSQAAMLVLSPVLPDVARDLGVSTATAGQLRSLSGLTGGATAVLLAMAPRRPGLRDLLSAGATFVAAGSALSAAAPSFPLLAAAQGVAGIGIGLLVAVGIAAAGEWPAAEQRPGVLAFAIAGMPAAWRWRNRREPTWPVAPVTPTFFGAITTPPPAARWRHRAERARRR